MKKIVSGSALLLGILFFNSCVKIEDELPACYPDRVSTCEECCKEKGFNKGELRASGNGNVSCNCSL